VVSPSISSNNNSSSSQSAKLLSYNESTSAESLVRHAAPKLKEPSYKIGSPKAITILTPMVKHLKAPQKISMRAVGNKQQGNKFNSTAFGSTGINIFSKFSNEQSRQERR
jgi:hypothetical protein